MKFCQKIIFASFALSSVVSITSAEYYMYIWAGPKNHTANDFVATFALNSDLTSVTFKSNVDVGTHNNEPHHMYIDSTGKKAYAAGLLSFTNPGSQPDNYFFDLNLDADPGTPKFLSSDYVGYGTAADAGLALPNGGFFVTMMGGPKGGPGGSIVEYDKNFKQVRSLQPADEAALGFNPHGIDVTQYPGDDYFITADFLVPATTVGGPIQMWDTARVWQLSNRSFLKTVDLAAGSNQTGIGAMNVAFLYNDHGAIVNTASGGLYYVDPVAGTSVLAYNFTDGAEPHVISSSRKKPRLFVSGYSSNTLYMFDTTNPTKLSVIASVQIGKGPHFLFLDPEEKFISVSYYFLDESYMGGLVKKPGDQFVRTFKLDDDLKTVTHLPDLDVDLSKPPFEANPHGFIIVKTGGDSNGGNSNGGNNSTNGSSDKKNSAFVLSPSNNYGLLFGTALFTLFFLSQLC